MYSPAFWWSANVWMQDALAKSQIFTVVSPLLVANCKPLNTPQTSKGVTKPCADIYAAVRQLHILAQCTAPTVCSGRCRQRASGPAGRHFWEVFDVDDLTFDFSRWRLAHRLLMLWKNFTPILGLLHISASDSPYGTDRWREADGRKSKMRNTAY